MHAMKAAFKSSTDGCAPSLSACAWRRSDSSSLSSKTPDSSESRSSKILSMSLFTVERCRAFTARRNSFPLISPEPLYSHDCRSRRSRAPSAAIACLSASSFVASISSARTPATSAGSARTAPSFSSTVSQPRSMSPYRSTSSHHAVGAAREARRRYPWRPHRSLPNRLWIEHAARAALSRPVPMSCLSRWVCAYCRQVVACWRSPSSSSSSLFFLSPPPTAQPPVDGSSSNGAILQQAPFYYLQQHARRPLAELGRPELGTFAQDEVVRVAPQGPHAAHRPFGLEGSHRLGLVVELRVQLIVVDPVLICCERDICR
eukprot:5523457-Prymnesium_polylepis.1